MIKIDIPQPDSTDSDDFFFKCPGSSRKCSHKKNMKIAPIKVKTILLHICQIENENHQRSMNLIVKHRLSVCVIRAHLKHGLSKILYL